VDASQEITAFQIALPDGIIKAVAETCTGLSLRGAMSAARSILANCHRFTCRDGHRSLSRLNGSTNMVKILRFITAVVAGLIVGSVVNMSLISISGSVIALPGGLKAPLPHVYRGDGKMVIEVTTIEGPNASLPQFEPKHFAFPFLAHALGTLVGAFIAGLIALPHSRGPVYVVGALFFLGGVINAVLHPTPVWFIAIDLLFAYVPTAWLGQRLARKIRQNAAKDKEATV
jgi:hypothetical protein